MEESKKIIRRLDAIIILLVCMLEKGDNLPKLSELFYRLKNIGLANEEIASMFGKTPQQVAKNAYEFKRPEKRKDGK